MYQAVVALLASVYNLVVGNLNLSKIVVVALYVPGCCWLACTTWWREILITQKLSSLPYMYLVVVGQRVPLGGGKFESIKYCRLCLICTWLLLASMHHLVAGNLNLSKIVIFALYICTWLLLASVYHLVAGNLNL